MSALRAVPSQVFTVQELHGIEGRLCGFVLMGRPPEPLLSDLRPVDFDHPGHRALWVLLRQRQATGLPMDHPTVLESLIANDPGNVLDLLGGPVAFCEIATIGAMRLSPDSLRDHVRTVKRAALERRLQGALANLDALMKAGDLKGQESARSTLSSLISALERFDRGQGERPALEGAPEVWRRTLERMGNDMAERGTLGLTFGIPALDREMAPGIRPGRLWVIGAGTGEGKTVLALQAALETARRGRGVLYLSWEMPGEELLERAVAFEANVPAWRIQRRDFDNEHIDRLEQWNPAKGLLIPLVSGMSAAGIPRLVDEARVKLRGDGLELGLVVIDHLQLVHAAERHETRALEVKAIANLAKEIALSGPVAVLALSQLSRARDKSKPSAWDLKESGGIEEAADTVLLLVRDRDEKHRLTSEAKVHVAKNRGGAVGPEVPLVFSKDHLAFFDEGE